MIYKAYLVQEGGGCDYTIGCGVRVMDLKVTTLEQAVTELEGIVKDFTAESSLQSAEVFAIEEVVAVDTKRIYADLARERQRKIEIRQEASDRLEYARLKAKFGG